MARQTFTKGQTVYINRYGSTWQKAVVAEPEIAERVRASGMTGRYRYTYYVSVYYIRDSKPDTERPWNIINNRQRIVTEEGHAEIMRGQDTANMHETIRAHRKFEAEFQPFVARAEIIFDSLDGANREDIEDLAHYLRGVFILRSEWAHMTTGDVRDARAKYLKEAVEAQATLRERG